MRMRQQGVEKMVSLVWTWRTSNLYEKSPRNNVHQSRVECLYIEEVERQVETLQHTGERRKRLNRNKRYTSSSNSVSARRESKTSKFAQHTQSSMTNKSECASDSGSEGASRLKSEITEQIVLMNLTLKLTCVPIQLLNFSTVNRKNVKNLTQIWLCADGKSINSAKVNFRLS